jgi:UDP-3-O-[3-hydroxymyristoyl] glucosamine N-acyltransferase
VDHVATLPSAGRGALTYLTNSAYKGELSRTKASVVVLAPADAEDSPVATLICADPYAAYARMADVIHPAPALVPGVHPLAAVHDSAHVAGSAQIDAHVSIGERTVIGERVYIGPGTVIGSDCTIGDGCRLVANISIPRKVTIGRRGLVHPGAVIGADGFGNAMTNEGWVKVPQVGGVVIGDDVEIGANTTIDCGAIDDTVIEDGVRIDNLCMIAHNVHVGAHTAMAAGVGIAGSAKIGKRCMFAGHSGTVGHVSVCDDVVVSGKCVITKNITEPGVYASMFPAEEARSWNRRIARFRRLETLYERVGKLESDRT